MKQPGRRKGEGWASGHTAQERLGRFKQARGGGTHSVAPTMASGSQSQEARRRLAQALGWVFPP